MTQPPAGYLIRHRDGLRGQRGIAYDYVMAGNGVWVESEGKLLAARALVAPAAIKGLPDLEPRLVLRHGPIPGRLWDLALSTMMADHRRERYVAVVWSGRSYQLEVPEQDRSAAGLRNIQLPENRVLDLHSHCNMDAFFSSTDNADETGFQAYGVVGKLPSRPQVRLRVGIYGHFHEVPWAEVFDGHIGADVVDCVTREASVIPDVDGTMPLGDVPDGMLVDFHGEDVTVVGLSETMPGKVKIRDGHGLRYEPGTTRVTLLEPVEGEPR